MVQYTLIEHTECTDVLNVIIAIATIYSVIKSQPECDINESTAAGTAWKPYYCGALNDAQLYLAVTVLFIFYFIYTLYSVWLDSNMMSKMKEKLFGTAPARTVTKLSIQLG